MYPFPITFWYGGRRRASITTQLRGWSDTLTAADDATLLQAVSQEAADIATLTEAWERAATLQPEKAWSESLTAADSVTLSITEHKSAADSATLGEAWARAAEAVPVVDREWADTLMAADAVDLDIDPGGPSDLDAVHDDSTCPTRKVIISTSFAGEKRLEWSTDGVDWMLLNSAWTGTTFNHDSNGPSVGDNFYRARDVNSAVWHNAYAFVLCPE